MSKDTVTRIVLEFVARKDEVTAAAIAAYLVSSVCDELGIAEPSSDTAPVATSVLWRGAVSFAKDIIKRPRVIEDILDEEPDDQGALFPGLGAFVRVDRGRDGEWRFKRRHALTQDEYRSAMALLREKSDQLAAKIERYQEEFDRALPFWRPGMTFGDALTAAVECSQ